MIETYRGVVYPHHIDHMGHMNVKWHAAKFDEATWHLFSMTGISSSYIRENNKGMAAVEQTTKYKAEAVAGDLIVIKSKILEVTDKIIRFIHVMLNSETGMELSTSELVGVHFDRKKRKSCVIPEEIKERCADLMGQL